MLRIAKYSEGLPLLVCDAVTDKFGGRALNLKPKTMDHQQDGQIRLPIEEARAAKWRLGRER
jgi:hypothetical protein